MIASLFRNFIIDQHGVSHDRDVERNIVDNVDNNAIGNSNATMVLRHTKIVG
jgi:hypothetical protein